jgi:hypothetical protein
MKSYKLTAIFFSWHGNEIRVTSTDAQVIELAVRESGNLISSCKANTIELPSGEKYACEITKLKGHAYDRAYEVGWWIIKQLCLSGWEPFYYVDGTHFLRLAYEEGEAQTAT